MWHVGRAMEQPVYPVTAVCLDHRVSIFVGHFLNDIADIPIFHPGAHYEVTTELQCIYLQ